MTSNVDNATPTPGQSFARFASDGAAPARSPNPRSLPEDPAMSPNVTVCHTCADRLRPASQDEALAERPEEEKLSDRQLRAVVLMLDGKHDSEVAQQVGVSRRTLIRWRLEDADFIAELRRRRRQLWNATADRLRSLLDPAVDVLAEQLRDRYDRTRFRAATTILRLANVKSAVPVNDEEVE